MGRRTGHSGGNDGDYGKREFIDINSLDPAILWAFSHSFAVRHSHLLSLEDTVNRCKRDYPNPAFADFGTVSLLC